MIDGDPNDPAWKRAVLCELKECQGGEYQFPEKPSVRMMWNDQGIYVLLTALKKPKDFTRFEILCRSCLTHDAYEDLGKIRCPVSLIAADQDRVLGGDASVEIQRKIPGSRLYMYHGYSHGVYEQAKDFNGRVLRMLAD